MARNYEQIKVVLEQMKSELLAASRNKENIGEAGSQTASGDDVDRASALREQEFNIIIGARDRQKMRNIEVSLRKIDKGEYGICEECEEDIPLGRLKVMPFARYCVACQSEFERYQAITRSSGAETFDAMFGDEDGEEEKDFPESPEV